MAAPIENGDFYVHAEFVSLLKVANICVSSASMTSVLQVICDATQISIMTVDRNFAMATRKTAILKWPPSVRLLPDTCSQLKCTTRALTLRCQYELVHIDEVLVNHVFRPRTFERIVCCACGNNLMSVCKPRSSKSRVDISATGLSWEHMNLSYFCHDHEDDDDADIDVHEQLAMTSFGPRIDEYFDHTVHVVFNNDVLNRDRMLLSESTGDANCVTCHKRIGQFVSTPKASPFHLRQLKLYSDAVGCVVDDASCDELVIFANILKSYHKTHRRLCLMDATLDSDLKSYTVLLVAIMDDNLKTMGAAVSDGVASMKTVWKLLYRTDEMDADGLVMEQWSDSSTVMMVRVQRELFDKFGRALTKITKELPMDWRFADKFCVSYIPKFD